MQNDILILDNVIPEVMADKFEKQILRNDFDWFYLINTTRNYDSTQNTIDFNLSNNLEIIESCGFSHSVYNDYRWHNPYSVLQTSIFILESFAEMMKIDYHDIMRIKINMGLQNNSNEFLVQSPHVDSPEIHKTLLYYINDSDGDTILYDKLWSVNDTNQTINLTPIKRITPKRGRCVLFDGHRYHSASNPINSINRLALNINFV